MRFCCCVMHEQSHNTDICYFPLLNYARHARQIQVATKLKSQSSNWCLTCGRRAWATGPADHCGPCCGPTSSCTGYWRVTSTFLQARAACATQKVKAYLYPCVHLDTAASNRDVRCKWHSRPKAVHLCACKQLFQLSSFYIYFE
jgi:hypothetical protein